MLSDILQGIDYRHDFLLILRKVFKEFIIDNQGNKMRQMIRLYDVILLLIQIVGNNNFIRVFLL